MPKIFLLFLLIISNIAFSQNEKQTFNLKGSVADSVSKTALGNAYIKLDNQRTGYTKTIISDTKGQFMFKDLPKGGYAFSITFVGYQSIKKRIRLQDQDLDMGVVLLKDDATALAEVNIKGRLSTGSQKADTVQFNAKAFKVNVDATAEDLVEKLPGATTENGKMQIQGEEVKQVMVDGKLFFGKDATAALKNLPAEVIDKIQVFDQQSDQAQFTGIDDGNTQKTLNIITNPAMRNGQFGRLAAGYGTNDTYRANGVINNFDNARRITVLGQGNNLNQQNFSSEDLLGVSSGAGRQQRGGGGAGGNRGGNGGQGGSFGGGAGGGGDASSNFLVGNQSGLNTTNALGLNYSDDWGKKVKVTGSYFFNQAQNLTNDNTFRQYLASGTNGQQYSETGKDESNNFSNRANMRIDYKIDDNNSVLISPTISIQKNHLSTGFNGQTMLNTSKLNESLSLLISDQTAINFSNNALFRHRFAKRGRNLTFNLNNAFNNKTGDNSLNSSNIFYGTRPSIKLLNQQSNSNAATWSIGSSVTYSEPIGKKNMTTFVSLGVNYNENNSEKLAYNFSDTERLYNRLDTLLSNSFASNYLRYNVGTGIRQFSQKLQFNLDVKYQTASLINNQTFPKSYYLERNFQNILPSLNFRYTFANKGRSLRFNYGTQTQQPSISQLQEVVNNTNPLKISSGNSALSQEYQHNLSLRYSATNTGRSTNFLALMSASFVQGNITNALIIADREPLVITKEITLQPGAQLTRPVNLDGQYSIRAFMSYGLPVPFLKSNLNTNVSVNYGRTPGLVNGLLNESTSKRYVGGLVLSSNISQKIDFTLSSNTNFNYTNNSLYSSLNNEFVTQNAKARLNIIFGKSFVFNTDFTYYTYSGLSASFNQRFSLWNMAIGKKILKNQRGDIRLSVFDLLSQNNSIDRNITVSYIEDLRTNVLQRYYMLAFTYNIRSYKK